MKKNIIFDLGNVLIKWNARNIYNKYFANDLEKIEDFFNTTNIFHANAEMDRSIFSFDEILQKLIADFPKHAEPLYLWKHNWLETIEGPIHENVAIVKKLHAKKYPIFVLSNWAKETFYTHIRYNKEYDFLNLFKNITISGDEKIIKPEIDIYKIVLQKNQLLPHNCIYIDDTAENLIPAKELGMMIIKYETTQKLLSDLKEYGVHL
jgi:2-haloacid dehalogenase